VIRKWRMGKKEINPQSRSTSVSSAEEACKRKQEERHIGLQGDN
jgi:hypothetical protein